MSWLRRVGTALVVAFFGALTIWIVVALVSVAIAWLSSVVSATLLPVLFAILFVGTLVLDMLMDRGAQQTRRRLDEP